MSANDVNAVLREQNRVFLTARWRQTEIAIASLRAAINEAPSGAQVGMLELLQDLESRLGETMEALTKNRARAASRRREQRDRG